MVTSMKMAHGPVLIKHSMTKYIVLYSTNSLIVLAWAKTPPEGILTHVLLHDFSTYLDNSLSFVKYPICPSTMMIQHYLSGLPS